MLQLLVMKKSLEDITGFVVDESNQEIWVYDGAGLSRLSSTNGGLIQRVHVTLMDDIDLDEPIIIGG